MMDMPVAIVRQWDVSMLESVDIGKLNQQVANFSPVMAVIRHTWNTQTLSDIIDGRVTVPDDVINDSLARYTADNAKVYDITVNSLADGRLNIKAETENFGAVDLMCRIEQFRHDKDVSFLKFTIIDKKLPENEILSGLFSRLSLSMLEKMVGRVELDDSVKIRVSGDTVAIDFHEALLASQFGQANVLGYRLCDALCIEEIVPREGYMEFKTSLIMPEAVKTMLYNIVR